MTPALKKGLMLSAYINSTVIFIGEPHAALPPVLKTLLLMLLTAGSMHAAMADDDEGVRGGLVAGVARVVVSPVQRHHNTKRMCVLPHGLPSRFAALWFLATLDG